MEIKVESGLLVKQENKSAKNFKMPFEFYALKMC